MNDANRSFLGTGWSFPPTFRIDAGQVDMVSDETDIQQSLHILLTTTLGERLLRPRYGCDLRAYLFEPLDTALVTYIHDLVATAILYFEPRITLLNLDLTDEPLEGRLLIELSYRIRATNARANAVFPFYKGEGSDVPT